MRRRGIAVGGWLAGWLISPPTAFALGVALVTLIWSIIDGLPAVAVFVLSMGAAAFALGSAAGLTVLWERLRRRYSPLSAFGKNLHLFTPDENLRLAIGTLVITNRSSQAKLNVDVTFHLPLVDGPTLTAPALTPEFIAVTGLSHPRLVATPLVVPPHESFSGDFAAVVPMKEVELEELTTTVHDLVSGHKVEVRFL